jgi:hypothetical protein
MLHAKHIHDKTIFKPTQVLGCAVYPLYGDRNLQSTCIYIKRNDNIERLPLITTAAQLPYPLPPNPLLPPAILTRGATTAASKHEPIDTQIITDHHLVPASVQRSCWGVSQPNSLHWYSVGEGRCPN